MPPSWRCLAEYVDLYERGLALGARGERADHDDLAEQLGVLAHALAGSRKPR
jgi:hypothetical protein